MAARQQHGINFEQAVKSLLKVEDTKSYTAKWDIGEDTSVKFIKAGSSIDMGSVTRIFEALETPGWRMILGRHTNGMCEYVQDFIFTSEICSKLKGKLTLEDVSEFDKKIKSYAVGYHEPARAFAKQWKAQHKSVTGMLTISPKIDSKNQRRVQCGINNGNFCKLFPEAKHNNTYDSLVGELF